MSVHTFLDPRCPRCAALRAADWEARKAEQGIKLTDPDPELAAYQQKFRRKEAA